jgi:FlaA1/EpsC-like NDP-sugar epimerase
MLPAYTDIADGSISVSNIKEVEIEDLLGRKPVSLDRTEVSQFIRGKSVMVSGGRRQHRLRALQADRRLQAFQDGAF